MIRTLALAALLATPALARAHDLWVERTPEGAGFAVRYGHRGGEALPLDPATVKAIRCADAAGAVRDLRAEARASGTELRFDGSCAAVGVVQDGGFWSLTPDGEVNLPKNRAQGAVRAWASRQYAKWVDVRSPRAGVPLGEALELVPVSELARAHQGDKVTLRLLAAGKPVSDAVVAIDHHPLGETDSKGEVRIRVRAASVESISATVKRPLATPEADAEVLEASLTFQVAP